MVDEFKCKKCGTSGKSIPTNLMCEKCGTEYLLDNELNNYLPKAMKCFKCHKESAAIATKRFCDKCSAVYMPKPLDSTGSLIIFGIVVLIMLFGVIFGFYRYIGGYGADNLILALFFAAISYYFGKGMYEAITKPTYELVLAPEGHVAQQEKPAAKKPQSKAALKAELKARLESARQAKAAQIEEMDEAKTNVIVGLKFILLLAIIITVWIGYNSLFGQKGNVVEIDGVKFTAPDGWTVNKYPDPNILVEAIGPKEGVSSPYFSIEKDDCDGTWQECIDASRSSLYEIGAELGTSVEMISEYDDTVAGKKAYAFRYRVYAPNQGIYKKGLVYVLSMGSGQYIGITFMSPEDSYGKNNAIFDDVIMPSLSFPGYS